MSKGGKHNAMDVLREESSTELIVLEGLQMVDLELVMVAASQLLQKTLLVAIRAAARIEPRVRDEPCVEKQMFARKSHLTAQNFEAASAAQRPG